MLISRISGREALPVSDFMPDKKKTICITGHRESYIKPFDNDPANLRLTNAAVKLMLFRYIDLAIENGYTDFISGLATGTDLWAAKHILKRKAEDPHIHLIGMMPYLLHAENYNAEYKEILREVELNADRLYIVSQVPNITYSSVSRRDGTTSRDLYRNRNYAMVDRAGGVIAFLNEGTASGTAQTVRYAERQGRKIYRFSLLDVYRIIKKAGTDIEAISSHIQLLNSESELFWI